MRAEWSKVGENSLTSYRKWLRDHEVLSKRSKKLHRHKRSKSKNSTDDDIHTVVIREIEKLDEHPDSIFPNKNGFKYNNEKYKMFAHSGQNYIIFYKIVKDDNDKEYADISNAQHFNQLQKDLNNKNVQPLSDDEVDPDLMLEYLKTERQILIDELDDDEELDADYKKEWEERVEKLEKRSKEKHSKDRDDKDKSSDNDNDNDDGEEAEVTDPETGKKVKKKRHTGERGGKYYIGKGGERVYPPEWNGHKNESKSILIPITEYLQKSKMITISDYINRYLN